MAKVDWKNVLERALWTFVEAVLVTFPMVELGSMDIEALKVAAFAAMIAGVSAVKTLILEVIKTHNLKGVSE